MEDDAEALWGRCFQALEETVDEQALNTWIRPLQAQKRGDILRLLAPNSVVLEQIDQRFLKEIHRTIERMRPGTRVTIEVGSAAKAEIEKKSSSFSTASIRFENRLNTAFTFDAFVEGSSNKLACATSRQVAGDPGRAFNPLFLYGLTGLGKTHLMHAVGHQLLQERPDSQILYIRSERFVREMVKSIQRKTIDQFKNYFRSLDALLIDDIHFFAGKQQSQEEFFHIFNYLLEDNRQVILTNDLYPKEINHLEDRLKSRFTSGVTVAIQPPEFETRVAILMNKAESAKLDLSEEVAFFLAHLVQSNVRELEGALNNVRAHVGMIGAPITLKTAREALKDLVAIQDRQISMDNIQRVVADYFHIRISDLFSRSRSRSIARPRQIAMALARELTEKSLPEIGGAFGGRNHTTVMHACKTVQRLRESEREIQRAYVELQRRLAT